MAIEGSEVRAKVGQVEKLVDAAQKVAGGNVIIEVEGIKQPLLIAAVLSHHAASLPRRMRYTATPIAIRNNGIFNRSMYSACVNT
jgi:hypothetical protein